MTLYRLVFRSECAFPGDRGQAEAEMREISARFGGLNAACGVSSALMISDRTILQAIEGPLTAVEQTFERICGDVRHRRLHLVDFSAVAERCFAEWPMAVISTHGGLSSLCGQSDILAGGRLDPATVEAMLQLMRSMILTEGSAARPAAVSA